MENPAITVEQCKSKSITFYKVIENHVVYVSVTLQDIPSNIKEKPPTKSFSSIGEYLAGLGDVVEAILSEKVLNEETSNRTSQP